MGGSLMQLVAQGAQDNYITGNPQITYFKAIYRRHTNFVIESIENNFEGHIDLGKKIICSIPRKGDLLYKTYLEIDLEIPQKIDSGGNITNVSLVNRFGLAMIDYIEFKIGGQVIDKHYGEWMDIWTQLSMNKEEYTKFKRLIDGSFVKDNMYKIYIPLFFWFTRQPGLALPLIALQYHDVRLIVKFKKFTSICKEFPNYQKPIIHNCLLFSDYIFLDTDERRRFGSNTHEYLIEQVQVGIRSELPIERDTVNLYLNLNHPCKELVWVCQSEIFRKNATLTEDNSFLEPFCYSNGNSYNADHVKKGVLILNGNDRFYENNGTYFRIIQPFQHHTGAFEQSNDPLITKGFIYNYSFSMNPEEYQPSGTCNFSRIDTTVLKLELNDFSFNSSEKKYIHVYATNYNILKINSGMGGLAYSN
jgi:hypothetical protein